MYRTSEYRRTQREKKIRRKEAILKAYRPDNMPGDVDSRDLMHYYHGPFTGMYGDCNPYWMVEHRGSLAKGKIHCSCPMCTFKGATRQDRRNAEKMLADLEDIGMRNITAAEKLKKEIANTKFD